MISNRFFSREDLREFISLKEGLGTHLILELYDCDPEVLNSLPWIEEILLKTAKAANLKIISQRTHQFNPYGVTSMVLISESHLSIHTWPEHGFVAADIFVCGSEARKAADILVKELKPKRVEILELIRGVDIQASHDK